MKTKVTYGKPTKKQVEKFERTVKEMVEGRKPKKAVTDAVAKLVAKWRERRWNTEHAEIAKNMCADELEAVLATAPPEQTVTMSTKMAEDTFCVVEDGVPKFYPRTVNQADPPQAASAGALDGTHNPIVSKAAQRIEEYLRPKTYNPNTFDCSVYSVVQDALKDALAAHDQKVRAETLEDIASREYYQEELGGFLPLPKKVQDAIRSLAAPDPAVSKPEASPKGQS